MSLPVMQTVMHHVCTGSTTFVNNTATTTVTVLLSVLLARNVIYTFRAYAMMPESVCLSICL